MGEKKKRSIVSHVIRWLVLALIGITIGINFYLVSASKLGGNKMPMPFGTGCAVVLSGSMEPNLSVNDLIVVRKADNYTTNDVVVYQSGYELIVHRIVNVEGKTITTKGDANNTTDNPIDVSAIKGKVTFKIPGIGLLATILKTPVAILVLGISAFVFMEMSFRKEKEVDSKELEAIKKEICELKSRIEEETK